MRIRYNKGEMAIKKWFILSFLTVTIIAIVTGLCFFYFGNQDVKGHAPVLSVKEIEGDPCLIAEYNDSYAYRFKLEQEIDGKFETLGEIESKTNTLNLTEQTITFLPGLKYRFSVCYATETNFGKYGQSVIWTSGDLSKVKNIKCENNSLSWSEVAFAEGYVLNFVEFEGDFVEEKVTTPNFDLSILTAGDYTLYIRAYLEDIYSEFVKVEIKFDGQSYKIYN